METIDNIPSFQDYLSNFTTDLSFLNFTINIFIAGVLGYILRIVYIRFGSSLNNRSLFSKNFVVLTMTTMFIITIVKSSLALSLGLVGALSIVRFRAAIKEPEELSYLFIAIAIGLALGANQIIITLIGFFAIVFIIILNKLFFSRDFFAKNSNNVFIKLSSEVSEEIDLSKILAILNQYCLSVNLSRYDEANNQIEATFLVEFENYDSLEKSKNTLRKLDKKLNFTYIENSI